MSLHLAAEPGSIAPSVVLPGDPLRARHIAQTLLRDASCVNERRGALGYTGLYADRRVTVQSTGMGMPSMSIYAHELMVDYGVRRLVRMGTCGSVQPGMKLGDLVLAQCASTDSAMNRRLFRGDFAAAADFALLQAAWERARAKGLTVHVGNVLTSDSFYGEDGALAPWDRYGVLAVEMETSALYTLAARHGAAALAILTVSDIVGSHEAMSGEERERSLVPMAKLALELAAL